MTSCSPVMRFRAYPLCQVPFSFVASRNRICYEGPKPVLVDIEPDSANIKPRPIQDAITPRTKAIFPAGAFGQPARLDVVSETWRVELTTA